LSASTETFSLVVGTAILKSASSKEFITTEGRNKAYMNLVKAGIDSLVVIGGDGSFTGAEVFNTEYGFPVMGIPGTIDNDIYGTSHTLGYDTALNTVIEVIDKIRDTASSHNRLFFVEVMGRDAGHIALNAGIGAGAEEILIPEENLGLERLLDSLQKSKSTGKSSSIVVIAEGDKIVVHVVANPPPTGYSESTFKPPGFEPALILGNCQYCACAIVKLTNASKESTIFFIYKIF
jgi:6-phosphofructokinase 1